MRPTLSDHHLTSLFHFACFAAAFNVARAALPQVDFDRMGLVGLAGSFAGLDFFNTTEVTFDDQSSTLLARAQDGSLTKVGSTNQGGSILSGCSADGKFYFGGSFSSVEGTTASNAAVYDPSKNSFSALGGGGLDGNVTAVFCNTPNDDIWFGGEFLGPTSGTSGFAGSVAVYTLKGDKWSPPPFAGLNGPVFSITQSPSSSKSLLLAGSFHTSFSGGQTNVTDNNNPNVPFSSGSTPFSSSLVPIPLSPNDIEASPSSKQADFANISNILCPKGDDGPGNTWLAQDGFQPFITIRTFSFLTASGIRLGNTFVDGRGTKTFTITTLPDNKVLTLNYTDPSDGQVKTCSDTCFLPQDKSIPYQDFLIAPNAESFTGLQITLAQWTGAGPGLHLLQILSDGAFASAASSQSASCFSPGGSTTQQNGDWTPTNVGTGIAGTEQTILTTHVNVGTSPDQGPNFTWKPYVSASGIYNVNMLIPGCVNLQDCASRTTVKVTITPGSGLQPVTTTISQAVNGDTVTLIYNGPIVPASPDFTTSIMLELADQPSGQGSNGQYDLVVDRIQLQLISAGTSGSSNGTVNGNGPGVSQSSFGIFDWSLDQSQSVNGTGVLPNSTETSVDTIGLQLAAAAGSKSGSVVRSVATHSSGTVFVAGNFTLSSGALNIVGSKNNALFTLQDSGLNGVVHSLMVSGDILYVGGEFQDTLSGSSKGAFRGVVSYDIQNNKWNALQAGVNGAVSSLSVLNNQLLVAGDFTVLPSSAGSSSGITSPGFAVWDISRGDWAQTGGFLNGKLSFVGNGTSSGTGFIAGNVEASQKVGSDGFVTISNGNKGSSNPNITALKVQLENVANPTATGSNLIARWMNIFARQSGPTALPTPVAAVAPAVLAGAFWKNSSSGREISILGGNFTLAVGSGSAQSLAFYDTETGEINPAIGTQLNGTVYALLVQGNQLFVGGQFTLSGSAQGGNGFAIYDLDKQQWDGTSIQALQGSNIIVRSITATSFKSGTVYVAGTFSGAGSLSTCQGICALDLPSSQWSALGSGIQGEVAFVDYAATDLSLLIAGGSISLSGGTAANVAMFAVANSTWTAVGDSSQIGGPVTALAVNNANSSSIFAAGPSSSGSFLSFWNGAKWSDVDNSSSLGSTSTVQQLMMVPLQADHSANSIIEPDRILMVSGSLASLNASTALFDGQSFTPYIVTTSPSGGLGSVSSLFHSLGQFSFDRHHFLATGVVILISIAISAGIVFLILLIGVVWTLCIRHHEADTGKFIGFTEDDDSLHGPSSLLEHINAATRSTILGAGAASPLEAAALNRDRETRNASPRMEHDDDPFAAEPSETHMARSNEDTIGTAIGGEDDVPRQSRVRFSFDGTGEGELPLSSGAEVEVLDSHDSAWWYVRDNNGREGVVPSSYLY